MVVVRAECTPEARPPARSRVTASRWMRLVVRVLWQSARGRSLRALFAGPLFEAEPLRVEGAERVPARGAFVLAVNHYAGRHTMEVVAQVLRASRARRPTLYDELAVVVGRPRRPRAGWRAWVRARATAWQRWLVGRWDKHLVRLALDHGIDGARTLRAWQRRAREAPTLVFPEGRLGCSLGPLRPGAGRWLARFDAPTVPVAVWFDAGVWHVRFGDPVAWTRRWQLHDVQLGLALAALLPEALRGEWSELHARWCRAWDREAG